MQIVAIDAFAIALHALYVLLSRHKLLPTAAGPQAYSNDQFRYELRMKPFLQITLPELVPYEEYSREATLQTSCHCGRHTGPFNIPLLLEHWFYTYMVQPGGIEAAYKEARSEGPKKGTHSLILCTSHLSLIVCV